MGLNGQPKMILFMENWVGHHYKIKYQSIIAYWFKILESQEIKFIKLAYQLMLNDIEIEPISVNWASKVTFLLSSLGFHEVWVNQGVEYKKAFLQIFKQRLSDSLSKIGIADLLSQVGQICIQFFSSFEHQMYLDCVKV